MDLNHRLMKLNMTVQPLGLDKGYWRRRARRYGLQQIWGELDEVEKEWLNESHLWQNKEYRHAVIQVAFYVVKGGFKVRLDKRVEMLEFARCLEDKKLLKSMGIQSVKQLDMLIQRGKRARNGGL